MCTLCVSVCVRVCIKTKLSVAGKCTKTKNATTSV